MVKNGLAFLAVVLILGSAPASAVEIAYKNSAYFKGQIPAAWNEYSNGFGYISKGITKDVVGEGGGSEAYAHNVSYSLGPNVICFSDVPEDRLDVFRLSAEQKDALVEKGRKTGTYAEEKIGRTAYVTITFAKTEEGGMQKEYFSPAHKDSKGAVSYDLIIQYPGSPAFGSDAKHFLATLEN